MRVMAVGLALALTPGWAQAPPAAIDATWIYTTALEWHKAPRGIDSRWTFASVAVLYPDGQYVEVDTVLIARRGKSLPAGFSAGDGNLVRGGTWARTDDDVIRIHSREVWWDDHVIKHVPRCSDVERKHCSVPDPMPGPFETDTCRLEGRSATHLASTIHCSRLSLVPLRIDLDPADLQQDAQLALTTR
jgi:hypothetical protein